MQDFSSIAEKLNSLLMDDKPLKTSATPLSESLPWLVAGREKVQEKLLGSSSAQAAPTTASNAEWNRRESELAQRERALRTSGYRSGGERMANFPSFWPICRHAILVDISFRQGRKIVSYSFLLWKVFIGALALAVASEVVSFVTTKGALGTLQGIAISVLFLFLFPAFVFSASHLSLYRAMVAESAVGFVLYFVFGILTLGLYSLMAVGIVDGLGGGILGAIAGVKGGFIAAGVMSAICAGCFLALVLGGVAVMQGAFTVYQNQYCPSGEARPGSESSPISQQRTSSVVERHAQV
jgi:hypothetical protein